MLSVELGHPWVRSTLACLPDALKLAVRLSQTRWGSPGEHSLSSGSHGSGGETHHFSLGVGGRSGGTSASRLVSVITSPPQTQAAYMPAHLGWYLFLVISLQGHLPPRASDLTPSVTVTRHPRQCDLSRGLLSSQFVGLEAQDLAAVLDV